MLAHSFRLVKLSLQGNNTFAYKNAKYPDYSIASASQYRTKELQYIALCFAEENILKENL